MIERHGSGHHGALEALAEPPRTRRSRRVIRWPSWSARRSSPSRQPR
jgi:hypothetical protein